MAFIILFHLFLICKWQNQASAWRKLWFLVLPWYPLSLPLRLNIQVFIFWLLCWSCYKMYEWTTKRILNIWNTFNIWKAKWATVNCMWVKEFIQGLSWSHFEYIINSLGMKLPLLCNAFYQILSLTFWCWHIVLEFLLNNIRILLWGNHAFHHDYFHPSSWNSLPVLPEKRKPVRFIFSIRSCNIYRLFKMMLLKIILELL